MRLIPSERNGECDETYQCEYFHRVIGGLLPKVHPADDAADNRDDPDGVNDLGLIGCLEVTLDELADVHEPSDDAEEDQDDDDEVGGDDYFHSKWLFPFELFADSPHVTTIILKIFKEFCKST